MNRFSYVALVDAVYFRAERQVPLGLSALDEVTAAWFRVFW